MKFRTSININEISVSNTPIDYTSKIALVGSCFVEHIGARLAYYKWEILSNPYGVLFSPVAVEKALSDIKNREKYSETDLVLHGDIWHSLHHHSDFSGLDQEQVLQRINRRIQETGKFLEKATHIIITLGTAWVYQYLGNGEIVANCHKIPQSNFQKKLLSIREIVQSLQNSIVLLYKMNPDIQIILSLSPVRHIKDGMQANALSKAHLLSAIHQVIDGRKVHYFPSYEILVDDLRDYRFYAEDMLHPGETAIRYIWHVFKQIWIHESAYATMELVRSVQKGLQHRSFYPESEAYRKFVVDLEKKKNVLYKKYGIDFSIDKQRKKI